MKKVVLVVLVLFGVLAVLAVLALGAIGLVAGLGTERVPRGTIVEIDFERGVIEALPDDPLGRLMMEDMQTVRGITDGLDRAANDSRVKGLVARIGAGGMGLAHLQEVRDALLRFRESGKPAIAFAETFGEFGPGNGGYYLATAFDEVYLQPSGDVGLTGIGYETMFLRGLFEKLEIDVLMEQRYEYKNAMNMYTEREFTPAHRESMQVLMDSQFGQMIRGVAEGRGLSEADVRARFDAGPYLGEEAVEAGLVDGTAYRDEVYSMVRERAGDDDAELLFIGPYLERAGSPHRKGTTIALIHGNGAVTRGASGFSPLTGAVTMGADTVSAALRAAVRDRAVKAIVFRVDSPGGSYVGSDTIWRETIRAREAGKPVIVSMGNLAGSGGYFVAMNADKIVAQPGTITASIGVLGGKLMTRELWRKLGVTFDGVYSSEHSQMYSPIHGYGDANGRFRASLDRIYEDFTSKVAAGRELPLDRVQQIAKGRIWTGEDALELGLVDALGGLDTAFDLAREALDLEQDAPFRVKRFPKQKSGLQLFLDNSGRPNSERMALLALRRGLATLQPYVALADRLGLGGHGAGELSMPPLPGDP